MAQAQSANEPVSITMTVSWTGDPHDQPVITGGVDNGANISIPYGDGNFISFQRTTGQEWTFQSFLLTVEVDNPVTGFALNSTWAVTVNDTELQVTDNNKDESGSPMQYTYALRLNGPSGPVTTDPVIINKASTTS